MSYKNVLKVFGAVFLSLILFVIKQNVFASNPCLATGGTTVSAGLYCIHTFTSSGTFDVPSGSLDVEALVVAGGGAGGTFVAGAGGAGGVIHVTGKSVTGTNSVTVGNGAPRTVSTGHGANGQDSIFADLTALGGGGGGYFGGNMDGNNGGSGGSGAWQTTPGNPGHGTSGQGHDAGITTPGDTASGGGGGAGGVGEDTYPATNVAGSFGGAGGIGVAYDISGINTYYGGGGGGWSTAWTNSGAPGGLGGGGNGSSGDYGGNIFAGDGTPNTGGGGGAGWIVSDGYTGGAGGSGIVIIKYAKPGVSLSSIAVTRPATKTVFNIGESLDISGLVVTGNYSDNTTFDEPVTLGNISGFNSASAASGQVLTVTYGGKTTTFMVDIANTLAFVSPTPNEGATLTIDPEIKLTTSALSHHYVFNNVNSTLAGWWRGEDNTTDDSGHNNTAIWKAYANTPSPAYMNGEFGRAFSLDGNSYVSIPHSSALNASTFTASAWVKFTGNSVGWNRIFSKMNQSNDGSGWEMTLDYYHHNQIYLSSPGSAVSIDCVGDWMDNTWHHVAAVYKGRNVKLYCDGAYKGGSVMNQVSANSFDLNLGRITGENSANNWVGGIDDALVINRALTESEIRSLYDASVYQYDATLTDLPTGALTMKGYSNLFDTTYYTTSVLNLTDHQAPETPIPVVGPGSYWYSINEEFSANRSTSMVYSTSPIPADEHCNAVTANTYTSPISISTTQTLHVRACNSYGDTDASFTYNMIVVPSAPLNLHRVSGSYTDLTLGWNAPSDLGGGTIQYYNLYYREKLDGYGFGGFYVPNSLTYQFSSGYFKPNHTYEFFIVALNETGQGAQSETIEYTFPSAPTYSLSTCLQLQNIRNDMYATYNLAQDIDCSLTNPSNPNFDWEGPWGEDGFQPIGNTSNRFYGTLNGHNHVVSNLYIYRPWSSWTGLFGTIDDGASVSNLGVTNVDITGYSNVGGLVGGLAGTLTNVYSTGSIHGNGNYVGGLVGTHVPGGNFQSSPLVYTWNGSKYDYIGDVGRSLARNLVGGDNLPIDGTRLVPKDGKYSINISQEYNEIVYYDELALKTFDHAPGYSIATSLQKSKSDQFYTVKDAPTNPLVSCTDKFGNNCLTALQSSDDKWSDTGAGEDYYWTLNFGNLAGASRILLVLQGAEDGYSKNLHYVQVKNGSGNWVNVYSGSTLSAMGGAPRKQVIDLTGKFIGSNYDVRVGYSKTRINYFAIDTTPQQAYTMNTYHPTKADLHFFGYTAITKKYFADHDYNSVSSTTPEYFAPQVGNFTKYGDVAELLQSTNDQFVVMHHGDQMATEFEYVAPAPGMERDFVLFNYDMFKHAKLGVVGKQVEPLPFAGMTKYPYTSPEKYPLTDANKNYIEKWNTRYVSGIIGPGSSTVINSYSTADVSGNYSVGGLVGYNDKLITGSYASGNVVNSSYYTGGLVGENGSNGIVLNSYATGNVTGSYDYNGGLLGQNYGTVTNTYATGHVTGFAYLGGLIGYDSTCGSCGVNNSFSTGDVTTTNESNNYLGGLIGQGGEFNYVSGNGGDTTGNNFWFNNLAQGLGDRTDGATKAESADYFKGAGIKTLSPFTGFWDFLNTPVWDTRENNYPYLHWQTTLPVITLLGTKHVILYQNQPYTDAGATALDGETDVTSSIEVSGTVDSTAVGTYSVTYTVTTGNGSAIPVVRTVEVLAPSSSESTLGSSDDTDIFLPTSVSDPTLNVSAFLSGNSITTPSNITITRTTTIGDVVIEIPAGITLTAGGSGWDGIINLPRIVSNPTISATSGTTADVFSSIEIGLGDTPITFDKAVRIFFPGAKDKKAGYSRGGVFTLITNECFDDTQDGENAHIASNSECKLNSGNDLVVWTKHFTTYSVYSETTTTTNSSGGGGVAVITPVAPKSENSKALDFTINNNASVTNTPKVQITFNADSTTVRGYVISLDSTFKNEGVKNYTNSATFDLPNIAGKYTVYVKYYSTTGHYSDVISKSITYTPGAKVASSKYQFKRNLKVGDKGEDVRQLQIFLNTHGFVIMTKGVGSPGKETNLFGALTKQALARYQEKNADKILKPQGLKKGTGTFSSGTMKEMNRVLESE